MYQEYSKAGCENHFATTWEYRYAIRNYTWADPFKPMYTLYQGEITETPLDCMYPTFYPLVYEPNIIHDCSTKWKILREYRMSGFPLERFFLLKQSYVVGLPKDLRELNMERLLLFRTEPEEGIGGRKIPFEMPATVDRSWFYNDFAMGKHRNVLVPSMDREVIVGAIFNMMYDDLVE